MAGALVSLNGMHSHSKKPKGPNMTAVGGYCLHPFPLASTLTLNPRK